MSLLLAAALAAAPATLPACSWDRPGANPFTGDVVAAVQRYTDIPEPVRKVLQARMAARQYDEIATISRDAISGKQRYRPEIRDMHFGAGTVCRTVTRKKWAADTVERGLVYCESGHCLIVPTVCRNVSRITRLLPERAVANAGDVADLASPRIAGAGGAQVDSGGRASAKAAGDSELQFDSPGAGGSFAQRAAANAPADAVALLTPGGGGSSTPDLLGNPPPGAGPGSGTGGTADAGGSPPGAPPFGGTDGSAGGGAGGTGGGSPPQPISTGGGGLGGGGLTGVDRPIDTITPPVTVVPEPGTWALMSLGALAVLGAARRRRKG